MYSKLPPHLRSFSISGRVVYVILCTYLEVH